jgi:hypothetical protein
VEKTLLELLDKEPFRPFRIVLTSGDRYEVLNRHLVAIGDSEIFYCYPQTDRFVYIRKNQIAALEALQAAA